MGEGWSDFYALSLLSQPSDNVNGNYPFGGYSCYEYYGFTEDYYYGVRRYLISLALSAEKQTPSVPANRI